MTPRPAAQLYTLRDFTTSGDGFRRALGRCAEIGYPAVQLSAVGAMAGDIPEVDAATARAWMDELGLRCCATHRPWRDLLDRTEEEIAFHRTLGADYVAVGHLGEYERRPDPYRTFAREAVPVARVLAEAGIRLGYHNHAHEFEPEPETGTPAYEALLEEADPVLMLEVDTYWVAHAGYDPAEILRRAAGRIPVVHLKDRAEDGAMAAVGEGTLDWGAILAACEVGGCEWLVVEQDVCPRDPYDCLRSSLDFLARKGIR